MASQQRTKDHLLPPPPPPPTAASPTMSPQDRNESNATPADIEEKRTPISPHDDSSTVAATNTANDKDTAHTSGEVTPAFRMRDISTVPPSSDRARHSPSPTVITSRRGRSRSPVASRPGSRASLRADRSVSADARGHANANGTISEAAIAAGEAAIAAKRGPSPFIEYGRRSPSPVGMRSRDGLRGGRDHGDNGFYGRDHPATVHRWPSAEQSFECSPIAYNFSLGSFDWANGPVEHGHGQHGAVGYGHSNSGGGYHVAHTHKRYPSPPPDVRYDDHYYDERYRDRHHDEYNQRYYYDDRYDRHYDRRDYRHSDRYRRDEYHYSRHHRSRRDRSGNGMSTSPHSERRKSQPLYSEHHILSTSSYREEDYSKKEDPRTHASFRDAPTPTAGNSRSRAPAGSVFRGVSEKDYKSNVVPALRAVEEVSPVTEEKFVDEGKKDAKKTKGKTGVKGSTKKKKKDTAVKTELPKELMLGLDDDSPPASPRESSTPGRNAPSPIHAASPTNIDKELSAIGIDTLDAINMIPGVDGDYLGNLSFRKSYDLEQMFSFMRSPKGSMKEATPSHGMMDLKFGSMSFTNSFLMSGSGEEKNEHDASLANDAPLKTRSHRRHPSSFGSHAHRRSRSPFYTGGIPTIHTLNSQTSSLGLTPINSFSGENAPMVRLTSHDGMALHSFFATSPVNVPDEEKDGGGHALPDPGMSMHQPPHQHGPPLMYGEYASGPFRRDHRITTTSHPPPPPSAPTRGPLRSPMPSNIFLAPNKRLKLLSSRLDTRPVRDLSKRADMFVLLKNLTSVFVGFQFKLPEVDSPLTEGCADNAYRPTDHQITIAKRRIFSSICAFGGCIPRRTVSYESDADLTPSQKKDKEDKILYEKELSSRYFMKEHSISWDVELHDVINPDKDNKGDAKNFDDSTSSSYCVPVTPSTPNNPSNSLDGSGLREKGKKVKYRCKLCGQPKQNHTCPYQSTVMRSIGTMVYPAVNAFVSDEPGRLAPALSEMNNFTSLLSQDVSISGSTRDYRPYNNGFHVLTPDSHWSPNTPGGLSTISTPSTPGGHGAPMIPSRKRDHLSMSRTMSGVSATGGVATGDDCLFRGTMELKPEQYRRVRFAVDAVTDAFQYPHIPTPYSQRKEMGDTLFALSREVPKLADACAAILREARENDCWDQAVAELTTQVLVLLKCEEQDYTLEGLKRHLLTLGIAC